MKTFYIKDKIVFSKDTTSYEIPPSIDDIKLPNETKNHLTNNKIIITDLQKIIEKKGKTLELSKPIKKFEEEKQKLINSKHKKKPLPDNYDFLEKTSTLQIVEGIINSFSSEREQILKQKINAYISRTLQDEKQKTASLNEQIDLEQSKLKKFIDEKQKFYTENIQDAEKQIEKSKQKILKIQDEKQKLEEKIGVNSTKNNQENSIKINQRISDLTHEVRNNELEIKILKAKIASLKSEIRLGKTKCFNWILFILTLGLIYWTKYSDCKYHLLRLEQKINKLNEKNLIIDKKKYNLQRELDNESTKDSKKSIENAQEAKKTVLRIEEIEIELNKEEHKIKDNEKELKQKEKESTKYDKDIDKIQDKLIELTSIKEEFDKYSVAKIEQKLEEVLKTSKEKIKQIEELNKQTKSQTTTIEGEWIIEI